MSKKTIFFLYGPIFTGKSFFAQSFSLARSLVPVTYVPDSQSVEQNRDFFAQIENSSLKGIPLGVIVDNFENFLGDVHRIINKLESLDSCYVFLISRKEERHTLGSLDLSKWSIMELHFPPLRDRREDILPLVESFFYERYNLTPEIDEETKKVLELYEWPKNIYEIKLLVSELDSARVDVDRLPAKFFEVPLQIDFRSEFYMPDSVSFIWRLKLKRILQQVGSLSAVAKTLGTSERTVRLLCQLIGFKELTSRQV